MYSYGPPHMAGQKLDDQLEHTFSPEDLPEAMNNREKWQERVRDICASDTTWWWWWWFIIIYVRLIIQLSVSLSCSKLGLINIFLEAIVIKLFCRQRRQFDILWLFGESGGNHGSWVFFFLNPPHQCDIISLSFKWF